MYMGNKTNDYIDYKNEFIHVDEYTIVVVRGASTYVLINAEYMGNTYYIGSFKTFRYHKVDELPIYHISFTNDETVDMTVNVETLQYLKNVLGVF